MLTPSTYLIKRNFSEIIKSSIHKVLHKIQARALHHIGCNGSQAMLTGLISAQVFHLCPVSAWWSTA